MTTHEQCTVFSTCIRTTCDIILDTTGEFTSINNEMHARKLLVQGPHFIRLVITDKCHISVLNRYALSQSIAMNSVAYNSYCHLWLIISFMKQPCSIFIIYLTLSMLDRSVALRVWHWHLKRTKHHMHLVENIMKSIACLPVHVCTQYRHLLYMIWYFSSFDTFVYEHIYKVFTRWCSWHIKRNEKFVSSLLHE